MVRHSFTHADLQLGVAIYAGTLPEPEGGEWWPLAKLEDAGLPTLFAKVAALVVANR